MLMAGLLPQVPIREIVERPDRRRDCPIEGAKILLGEPQIGAMVRPNVQGGRPLWVRGPGRIVQ
jgi:hypothetical protein